MPQRLYNSHMVRTWHALLELLWPHTDAPVAKVASGSTRTYNYTQFLFPYKDAAIQTLIKRTKYQADQVAAKQLAAYLDRYLHAMQTDYIIIPMPISYSRWRLRGYNHIELICKH